MKNHLRLILKFTKLITISFFLSIFWIEKSLAAQTIPRVISYQGAVLDSNGQPVTDALTFRFSLWKSSDFVPLKEDGSLNTQSEHYGGYFELQDITPSSNGNFHTAIGMINPLPDLQASIHKFLQVEVKPIAALDNDFELLDVDGVDNQTDNSFLSSTPYAFNADQVDNKEVGYSKDQIPYLDEQGKIKSSAIPNQINQSELIINNLDNAEDIKLRFGKTLGKIFKWAHKNNRFELSDSLFIWGNVASSGNTFLGDDQKDHVDISGDVNIKGLVNGRDIVSDGLRLDMLADQQPSSKQIKLLPTYIENKENLIAYWTLDNNFLDSSEKANHANQYGEITFYQDGAFNQAASFDGRNDYLYLDDLTTKANPYFDNEIITRTISLWYRANNTAKTQVIYEEGGGGNGLNIYLKDNKIHVGVWSTSNNFDGIWISSSTNRYDWNHLVFIIDSKVDKKIKLYLNGQLKQVSSLPISISAHSGDDAIGASIEQTRLSSEEIFSEEKGLYFAGLIDEFKIWDRALNETEIINEYNKDIDKLENVTSDNVFGALQEISSQMITSEERNKLNNIEEQATANKSASNITFTDPEEKKILQSDLIAHWTFEEGGQDSGPYSFDLINENTDFLAGYKGKGASFSEDEKRLYVPSSSNFAFADNDFTIEMWVNFMEEPLSYSNVLGTYQPGWLIGSNDKGNISFFDSEEWINTSINITTGWHFWTLVRQGDRLHFYLDGIYQETIVDFLTDIKADGALQMGHNNTWSKYFNPYDLDEVAIYKRALNSKEVLEDYQHGSGFSAKNIYSRLEVENVQKAILLLKQRIEELESKINN